MVSDKEFPCVISCGNVKAYLYQVYLLPLGCEGIRSCKTYRVFACMLVPWADPYILGAVCAGSPEKDGRYARVLIKLL